MCIRDSLHFAGVPLAAFFFIKPAGSPALFPLWVSIVPTASRRSKQPPPTAPSFRDIPKRTGQAAAPCQKRQTAVSYTHLDVYKRQGPACGSLTERRPAGHRGALTPAFTPSRRTVHPQQRGDPAAGAERGQTAAAVRAPRASFPPDRASPSSFTIHARSIFWLPVDQTCCCPAASGVFWACLLYTSRCV